MGKKVLITGGMGLIGSRLAEMCVRSGDEVAILSRSNSKIENLFPIINNIKLVMKDIKDISPSDVESQDQIFPFASTVDNYNIQTNPYLDVQTNCIGTIALLEACKESNPQARIVYPSTFFVNGNLNQLPATPQSPCNPLGLYPATKLAAENFCRVYNSVFGMNTVIARFTNVFGENEARDNKKKAAFNYMVGLALDGGEIQLYSGGNFYRDYIHVDDVANACRVIAEKGKTGEVYYVGNGKSQKFRDLIEIVIQEAGSGTIKDVEPPEFHKQVGIRDFYCDNSPLKELGWEPQVAMRDGIRGVINHYRKQK